MGSLCHRVDDEDVAPRRSIAILFGGLTGAVLGLVLGYWRSAGRASTSP